jgi:hypothetical protein
METRARAWSIAASIVAFTAPVQASSSIEPFGWYPPVLEGETSAFVSNDKPGRIGVGESVTRGRLDEASNLCEGLKGKLAPPDVTPAYVDVPLNVQGDWIRGTDFPRTRETANHHGMAVMSYTIGTSGAVDSCSVVQIDGMLSFGEAACHALMSRARFRPAHDSQGHPLQAGRIQRVRW